MAKKKKPVSNSSRKGVILTLIALFVLALISWFWATLSSDHPQTQTVIEKEVSTETLLLNRLERFQKRQSVGGNLQILSDEKNITLIMTPTLFFELDQAVFLPNGQALVGELAKSLLIVSNPITVEAHTDTLPLTTGPYSSLWELSSYQAFSIVKILIEVYHFSPAQVSGIGYGEVKPITPVVTTKNSLSNKRIVITIRKNQKQIAPAQKA